MTSKELLDKYVRACIEIDREEKNYIPLRPIEVSLKEKDSLEKEILKRIDEDDWHTGIPTEMGEYLVCRVPEAGWLFRYNQIVRYGDLMGLSRKKIFYIGEPGKIGFENVTDSVVAWQKIEPFKGE